MMLPVQVHPQGCYAQKLVFKEHDWVGITDGSGQQTFRVFAIVWGKDFEARHAGVPCSKALRVLSADASCSSVRAAEDDRDVRLTPRHVQLLGSGVYHLQSGMYGFMEQIRKGHCQQRKCSDCGHSSMRQEFVKALDA